MPRLNTQANLAIVSINNLLLSVFTLAILYFGQDIIIPMVLAMLLTFLLSPLVGKIERWTKRFPAVLCIVATIFFLVMVMGNILSQEFIDLISKFPTYKGNIDAKLHALPILQNDFVIAFLAKMQTMLLSDTLFKPETITGTAQSVLSTVMRMLVQIGFVMLLLIFMLMNREDLRDRVIKLLGQNHLRATTLAIDDAATRISHYLQMQLIINCSFGAALTIGLMLIGIPNAPLWGVLLTMLRFIPYIGTWIAAAIPVTLSLIISTTWMTPSLTIGLYLVLDLMCTNFVEPTLYGSSTGISSTALIIAAVFWTLLWGAPGLLLAIPLTVCLVVIGRHVPRMNFLSILLSDDKALELHEECYHRLLTGNLNEMIDLAEKYVKENSLLQFYEIVLIPVLVDIEKDSTSELLDDDKAQRLYQDMHDIVYHLNDSTAVTVETDQPTHDHCRVMCLAGQAESDDIAGEILTQVLRHKLFSAEYMTLDTRSDKIIAWIEENTIQVICLPVVSPSRFLQARNLCKKLKKLKSPPKIVICLWGNQGVDNEYIEKLRLAGTDAAVTTLSETLTALEAIADALPPEKKKASTPRKRRNA